MTTTINAGIRSIAVGFPRTVRTNDWFKENHREAFARAEASTLAKVFAAENGTARTRKFDDAMTRYLADPFRGTKERRVLAEDQSPIDLERDVAREALARADLAVEDIDLILVAAFPTANHVLGDGVYLASALGTELPAYNVESACSGGIALLQLANAMVASGQARNVLAVVSCSYSRACDFSDTVTWFLGDGVGAYVVGPVGDGEGFKAFHSINTAEACGAFEYRIEVDGGVARTAIRAGQEAGRKLRDMTQRVIHEACTEAARKAGVRLADIDFFVTNTPMAWFRDLFAATLGIPTAKTVCTYERFANLGPALNPVNLHAALATGRVRPGDTVLLFSIGGGSTAGAAVVRIGRVGVGELLER
jgi:3-oxoacyl-[acyl-carrier-protein] synthase-3